MRYHPIGPDYPEPRSGYCCPGLEVLKREVALRSEALDEFLEERDRRITAEFASQSFTVATAQKAAQDEGDKARVESDARLTQHEKDLKTLEGKLSTMEGAGAGKALSWGYVLGAVVIASGIISLLVDLLTKH